MWRTVLVFQLLAIIDCSLQLDSNGTETPAQCCPCPVGGPGAVDSEPAAGLRSAGVEAAGPGAASLDHCPCLARDADAEGAASMFFPHAVRAFGNVMRPDPKEDAKPLLHPEVDLASSVLETLREATDEEYRDALKRDAARAAAPDVMLLDAAEIIPEEARNVVTIIVSPQDMDVSDDIVSEASHVQETRCIHSPLGNSRASFNYRPPVNQKGLEDILNLPLPSGLLHRQRDSNLAASDVHESVAKPDNLNRLLSGLKLRIDPTLLSVTPNKIIENINNVPSNRNFGLGVVKNVDNVDRHIPINTNIAASAEKDDIISRNIADEDCISNFALLSNDSDIRSVSSEEDPNTNLFDLDSDPSASNIQEQLVKSNENPENSKERNNILPILKSPLLTPNIKAPLQKPFPLKNLFKLRDVELIPLDINKKIPKSKIYIPDLKFETFRNNRARPHIFDPIKNPNLTDLFGPPSKIFRETVGNNNKDNNDVKSDENSGHIQTISKRKEIITEILDTVPSPSETNHIVTGKEECSSLNPDSDKSANNANNLLDNVTNETVEPDAGIESDLLPNEEDFTNITDLESVEDIESKISSGTQNNELSHSEDFDAIDDNQTMNQNSDRDILTMSSEEIDDVPQSSVDLSELSEPGVRKNEMIDNHHSLKSLEEIRKSVVEKLDTLQVNNRNALDNIRQSMEEISEGIDPNSEEIQAHDLVSSNKQFSDDPISESSSPTSEIADEFKEVSAEEVSFADLQNMSDSILKASEKQCEDVTITSIKPQEDLKASETPEPSEDGKVIEIDSNEINENEFLGVGDIEQVQSKGTTSENGIKTRISNSIIKEEPIVENNDKNLCPSDLVEASPTKEIESSFTGNRKNAYTDNDLASLASEPIVNSILRPNSKSLVQHLSDLESKLRQNIIMQPSSLIKTDNLNIFRTPTLSFPDISELNANIPTLEEVRARVSEILSGLARQAGDEEVSSELDCDDFASNVNPMLSTDASSSNPGSIVSPLQPLEDINLDIIQLKPISLISSTNPLRTELPGLNLNTYKAKLAVPKSLDLKPLKLASTLGNGGGLVGARLSIEPEKRVKITKSKAKAKNSDVFSSDRLLEKDQGRIGTTLADITARMHSNARNLLTIPKSIREQTLQASNSLGNIAENLKSDTENAIKNIYQSISSSDLSNTVSALQKNTRNILQSPLTTRSGLLDNKLLSTGSMDVVVDNLKSQTENTFRNVPQSLSKSSSPDFNDSVHKAAKKILKSSAVLIPEKENFGKTVHTIPSIGGVVNNLLSQTESAMKNVQRTLNSPALSDRSNSIQKSAQNVFKSPKTTTRAGYLKNTLQPSLTLDTVVDNLKSQSQNTIKHIQKSLSTTMQQHAQDLLKSPIATGRDTLGNTLKVPPPMDLKPHTEKAVKDLQNTLKATLRNSPVKDLQQLTNPNNIMQMITNHQEDVNDKLFAIHTDLNDRLESIHNDVMDPERLKSILSPPSNSHFELFAIPLPSSRMSTPNSKKPANSVLKTKQPFSTPKQVLRKTFTPKVSKPNPGVGRASMGREHDSFKSFKMPKAASAPVPARTNRPLTPKKPTLPKSLDRDSLKKPSLSQPDIFKGMKRPFLPKQKPLVENKIKVTFGPTTLRPIPAASAQMVKPMGPPPSKPIASGPKRFKPKPPVRQPTPWNGWGEARSASKPTNEPTRKGDALTSPSQAFPKLRAPLRPNSATAISKKLAPTGSHLSPVSFRLKPHTEKNKPAKPLKFTPAPQGRASNRDTMLNRPEKPASSLLSKLTEALKNKQTKANLRSPGADLDVAPAGSDHVEKVVALEEPIKENVSYKCKMMCVKLD